MADSYVCTKDAPWTPEKATRAMHPDAEHIRDIDYGGGENTAQYKCPHCGKVFEHELPQ